MKRHYWKTLVEKDHPVDPLKVAEFPELDADHSHDGGRAPSRALGHEQNSDQEPAFDIEAKAEDDEKGLHRRDFLKYAGFGLSATMLAACQHRAADKAIPYLVQPEEIVPGRPYWIASTCGGCSAGCGVLVKCRDGRPIKLEGNPDHPLSKGGLCAIGQATVLEVYDSKRLKNPLATGKPTTWKDLDAAIRTKLAEANSRGGRVVVLSSTITSPTEKKAIDAFLAQFAQSKHVTHDALSTSAILDAHAATHGTRVLPRYRFDKAIEIVSFGADFLGTWISPVEYTAAYRAGRVPANSKMSHHVQIEPVMTLTGSNADERFVVAPSEVGAILSELASLIAAKAAVPFPSPRQDVGSGADASSGRGGRGDRLPLARLADALWSSRGSSLVVSGSQDVDHQKLVNFLNELLGNYGSTLDIANPSTQRSGDDAAVAQLLDDAKKGAIDALFILRANPLYDFPYRAKDLAGVPLVVSFSSTADETAETAHYVAPEHHFLESWRDADLGGGVVSVTQPAIAALGGTRAVVESLAAWSGQPRNAYDIMRASWQESLYPRRTDALQTFDTFWDKSVHDGAVTLRNDAIATAFNAVAVTPVSPKKAAGYELVVYPKVAIGDGSHAHNPFLQELPDPVTKVTWDNYASLSVDTAKNLGVVESDVIRIETIDGSIELPVYIQPGQHDNVVAIAYGYGRKGTERFHRVGPRWLFGKPTVEKGGRVGTSAAPLLAGSASRTFVIDGVSLARTGRTYALATTQRQQHLEVPKLNGGVLTAAAPEIYERRSIIEETTLVAFAKDPRSGAEKPEEHASLWNEQAYIGHRWAMAIDLNACTGCSACVVACSIENNVPVVGKDEVLREREMHWMRIDRYYTGEDRNLAVVHQPMMCQQCGHAPCETVCPVLATVHSSEGLNQQVYNRCVGTRYCANNCPYKARRFNWFEYPRDDRMENLVLNPDVTVRSRGVMEKCSFCVQRIELAKIETKRLGNGTKVPDGAVQTACQQSCPAQAIKFGDVNDPKSAIAKTKGDPRFYLVLEELGVQPSVGYLRVVRNREEIAGETKNV